MLSTGLFNGSITVYTMYKLMVSTGLVILRWGDAPEQKCAEIFLCAVCNIMDIELLFNCDKVHYLHKSFEHFYSETWLSFLIFLIFF